MSLSKQVTRARHAMFARHSNPWSAWTRWASAPLVLVPVWTRRRSDAALVAVWFALNPVIFPKPANDRAWATRAILGEELWVTNRPKDAATIVTGATARHRPMTAAVSCAVQMTLTLVYWEMMARYWDRQLATSR